MHISMLSNFMIIDGHCHAGKGDGLTGPWDTAAPLKLYLRRAMAAGISRTVIFSVFHSNYTIANQQVARIAAMFPQKLLGFAFVHPERDRGNVGKIIQESITKYRFRGIKVHRSDARITREVCETAQAFSLPVIYDVMGEVEVVELLATEYPDVSFIIPHLGSFADDWRVQLAMIDHLERHPNIYTDTSGVRRFDMLQRAVQRAGPEKIIFGSDGPWLHPGVELAKIRALRLGKAEERLVLGANMIRLIGKAVSHSVTRFAGNDSRPGVQRETYDPWESRSISLLT